MCEKNEGKNKYYKDEIISKTFRKKSGSKHMKIQEFGSAEKDTIILLHGGGLSWWNYRAEAEMLQADYHVVLPALDGHADSDRAFTSIESNAEDLIEFIDREYSGKVLLIGGLSLGAQVLLEILSKRKDICKYAIVESASVVPSIASLPAAPCMCSSINPGTTTEFSGRTMGSVIAFLSPIKAILPSLKPIFVLIKPFFST